MFLEYCVGAVAVTKTVIALWLVVIASAAVTYLDDRTLLTLHDGCEVYSRVARQDGL